MLIKLWLTTIDRRQHFSTDVIDSYESLLKIRIQALFSSTEVLFNRQEKQISIMLSGGQKIDLVSKSMLTEFQSDSINTNHGTTSIRKEIDSDLS